MTTLSRKDLDKLRYGTIVKIELVGKDWREEQHRTINCVLFRDGLITLKEDNILDFTSWYNIDSLNVKGLEINVYDCGNLVYEDLKTDSQRNPKGTFSAKITREQTIKARAYDFIMCHADETLTDFGFDYCEFVEYLLEKGE